MKRLGTADDIAHTITFRHGSDVSAIRLAAAASPWTGRTEVPQSQRLIVPSVVERDLRISMIYTVDRGPHASGWWRNSDYDACRHLSVTAMTKGPGAKIVTPPEMDVRVWARVWFGHDLHKAWNEPPAAENDPHRNAEASRHTWHVRVFVDQRGETIIPEGEVYTLKPWDDGTSPEKIHR